MRTGMVTFTIGLAVAVVALVWPALYNGQPFFHWDTLVYVRGAESGLRKVTGHASRWNPPKVAAAAADDAKPPAAAAIPTARSTADAAAAAAHDTAPTRDRGTPPRDNNVLAGRSVYYGILLLVGDVLGQFWFSVLMQAALLLSAMGLFLRAFGISLRPWLPIAGVAMAALTSASFFASYLMPDVFAAVTLLACACLIGARGLTPIDYGLWAALLAFSLVCHSSHLLIAAVLLSGALLAAALRLTRVDWRGVAVIAGCLALAGTAEAAFGIAVTRIDGVPPLRPPFLMARAIADGPGYRFLQQTCPGSGFKICEFQSRLPMSSDDFLWSWNPPGVFATASAAIRRDLSAEQYRFIAAVYHFDPAGLANAAIRDALSQFALMGLDEFGVEYPREGFAAKLPSDSRAAFLGSEAYLDSMPLQAAWTVQWAAFAAAAAALLVILALPGPRHRLARGQIRLVGWVIVGIAANAGICGVLSGPHNRYEARVTWLIPFTALCALLVAAQRRSFRFRQQDAP